MGYNGQAKDDEVYGKGNYINLGARQYDTRILYIPTVDPKAGAFPSQSPYAAFNGNPIIFSDPTGENGIWFLEPSGKTTTLVIKADYHYIQGQVSKSVLDAAKSEYGKFKKVNFDGGLVNVRFDINFIPHEEGADLSSYNGTDGQNRLVNMPLEGQTRLEESDYQEVRIDVVGINGVKSEVVTPEGKTVSLSKGDKFSKQVSTLIHGIGHNIGLIHDDKDVMNNQSSTLSVGDASSYLGLDKMQGSKIYIYSFKPNHVTKSNTQSLVNRLRSMSKDGQDYWRNHSYMTTDDEGLEGNGVTTEKK
jgi:hypothetical protein